jgi:hypothetical protein
MATQTVPHAHHAIYYASFHGSQCIVERTGHDTALLYDEDERLTLEVDQAIARDLVILGRVAIADTQLWHDTILGGYSSIACTRAMMEV